ncbi:Signal peptidase complex catalytic subunit SEC11A [Bagarius yarrelli]|uniref:Signal peptidase complex catalytic subunit SEC11 n=1 Tax=Bagarius yarrelli TaxID=175774 RepID=A0A556U1W9_BAGYA|nr:Signal peptidase complex catalytic subunit SEC11A [Bagarius yarrelli]
MLSLDCLDDVRRMNKRQLYYQVLNFGMIVSSALMIWKGLMVVTGSESPIVVVLSGSMEPAFHRGDLLFLTNRVEDPIRVGEIVVFRIEGREIPIVHRVLKVHENGKSRRAKELRDYFSETMDKQVDIIGDEMQGLDKNSVYADCQREKILRSTLRSEVERLDALILRFEVPDSRNRWDSPLFTIQKEERLPFEAISDAILKRKVPPPNKSTQSWSGNPLVDLSTRCLIPHTDKSYGVREMYKRNA